jgi:hypothetical protein
MSRPDKHPDLMNHIRYCIDTGRFLDTRHAVERQLGRQISRLDLLFALKNGFHEKAKDKFDENYQAWNYSIRGKTVDAQNLRIIVSFDENGMLIITAIVLKR